MSRLVQAIVALAFVPAFASAQFPGVTEGQRVRVWLPEQFRQNEGPWHRLVVRGTVASFSSDTLRLNVEGTSGTLAIPRTGIRRMELSRGRPRRIPSGLQRAVVGAIGGAIEIALQNDPYGREWPHYKRDWRAAEEGAKWGAAIGFVWGFVLPFEQWKHVRLRR